MEPIVLRRPLMARGRRSGKGDCRIVTITLLFATLLGVVIFVSYPGPGKNAPGAAGLLANLQGQAATLLGSHLKEATGKPSSETVQTAAELRKGLGIEQASITLQGPRSTIAVKQFQSETESYQGKLTEAGRESTQRDAEVRTSVADSVGADGGRLEEAVSREDDWMPEERGTDSGEEGTRPRLPRKGKPRTKTVREQDADPDSSLDVELVKDTSVEVWDGRQSEQRLGEAETKTDVMPGEAAALTDDEGKVERQAGSLRGGSFALSQREEVARSKESGPQDPARQWGSKALDKMGLAKGETEGNGERESSSGGRERPWKNASAEGLVRGPVNASTEGLVRGPVNASTEGLVQGPTNATRNSTGFAASLANALGLAGELLSATADRDALARTNADAVKLRLNGSSRAESVTGFSNCNESLANATGLFEMVLGNHTQALAFLEKLAGLGLTRREVEAVWARNDTSLLGDMGSAGVNTSCTSSMCTAVPLIKSLFPEALDTRTLYIGPDPCPLFQLLNGSALTGLEPVWNESAGSHPSERAYPQQSCGDSVTSRTPPRELRNGVAGAASKIGFDLVLVADTFEKLDAREARELIAAVAGAAAGPMIVAVGAVKQGTGRRGGEPQRERGLGTYEKDTWWVRAFAAEGLVEARAKSPLLEAARAELPGGALLHLVQARGANATEESAGEVASLLPSKGLPVTGTLRRETHPGSLDDDSLTADSLDENAPWTSTASEPTERREEVGRTRESQINGAKDESPDARGPLPAWGKSGSLAKAPKVADQRSGSQPGLSLRGVGSGGVVSDPVVPGESLPGVEKAGGRKKPAVGLASRVRDVVQEAEGERLQEALEREALAGELDPGKDRVDLVTLADSETESGATSMETAEDRKALNKRMPELVKKTFGWGASVKEVRKDLEEKRRK